MTTLPRLTLLDDGCEWPVMFGPDLEVTFLAQSVRRTATGPHAQIIITRENQFVIAHDTFNVTRSEDRRRLGKAAYDSLPDAKKLEVTVDQMRHQLDIFCLYVGNQYETARVQIERFDVEWRPPEKRFALWPYLLNDAGMILFAEPGVGKSFIVQAMAIALVTGSVQLFHITDIRSCLYINLERSRDSVGAREIAIYDALRIIRPRTGVEYIHARGAPLEQLRRRIKTWCNDNPDGVLFLDSVSRTSGTSSLKDDTTANSFIDTMNSFDRTWVGIGHSPRNDSGHVYGSMFFDAGIDIAATLKSVRVTDGRLVGIEVTKANDIKFPRTEYYKMSFGEEGLTEIRRANSDDMAVMTDVKEIDIVDEIEQAINEQFAGSANVTNLSEYTEKSRNKIRHELTTRKDRFEVDQSAEGHGTFYRTVKSRLVAE